MNTGPCACTWVTPSWGSRNVGYIWVNILVYKHEINYERRVGQLDKAHRPKFRFDCFQTCRDHPVKNWKLLYTRSVTYKRARQLGFEYHEHNDSEFRWFEEP